MNANHSYFYTPQYMMQFFKRHTPFNQGRIPTTNGQVISFAEYGNPNGKAVVNLHGGPGGMSQPIDLAFFDLTTYRVVIYDQRFCGMSQTSNDWTQFNTTQDLVNDLEALRRHLNINQWSLFGGSWGSCLGLCYAIQHPDRVETQIYWGILLGRQSCIDFVTPEMCSPMENFYCQNNFFLPENYILNNIDKIKDHVIKVVHGEEDNVCSVENAKELTFHLNNAELVIAPGEGHHPFMPEMYKALTQFAFNL